MAAPARRITRTLIALLTLGLLLPAALVDSLHRSSDERRGLLSPPETPLFATGELRVGVDPSYPPFAVAAADGMLSGVDIDLARAIGQRLNIPVRFVPLGYDGLYDALKTDQVDVLISALQTDDQRLSEVMYTLSYFDAGLVLVSADGSPFTDMDAMPGHRLAYEFGSVAESEARAWLRRVLPFEALPYELPDYALDAVRLGQADAALVDAVTARLYLRQHTDWSAEYHYVTHVRYAIAARLDRGRVWAAVNTALQTLIEDGTLEEITNQWL